MLKNKFVLAIFLMILISGLVSAQSVTILKTAPSEIKLGDNLNVKISIQNNLNEKISLNVRETVIGATAIDPQLITSSGSDPKIKAIMPPYFQWSIDVDANSKKDISYIIKPEKAGDYVISPTTATSTDGDTFNSDSLEVKVLCNSNKVCEPELGETYLTCSADCQSWSSDGVCNPARDNHCDADCAKGVDLDCNASVSFWQKIINFFKGLLGN